MDKHTIRQAIAQRKRQFTREQLGELSLPVIRRLLAHPRVQAAHTILLYHPLADEVDIRAALRSLSSQGKHLLLPVVTGTHTLELRRYRPLAPLVRGAFGILEPEGEAFTRWNEIELVVVPGVAFDEAGHRLGRGKGYYDALLAQLPHAYKLGICFDFQKLPSLPTEPHDIPMHELL